MMPSPLLIALVVLASLHTLAIAFTPARTTSISPPHKHRNIHVLSATTNPVEITFPTPQAAASLGIRDWPQTFHRTSWVESVSEGQIATRYVLDGNGRITINYFENDGRESLRKERVYPGTLVEVDGKATLKWEVDGEGMIVLTPGFEEGGKLAMVGTFFVVLCAALLAGSGGF